MAVVEVSPGDLVELGRMVLAMPERERLEYLMGLDPADLDVIERAVTAAEQDGADWRATPVTMGHHLTRGKIRLWRYSTLLGEKFVDAVEGRSIRQIWNLPRRYGKSMFASQWGPTWALDKYPHLKLLLVSYGDELALENAIAVRTNLLAFGDQLRARLQPDRRQAGRFVTTEGGGILARGIRSGIVGFGADGAVFDDPHKDWIDAHSPSQRQRVDDQFRSVVAGTLETETSWIIIPMTRWHEDDIAGRRLAQMEQETGLEWEVVRIPELAEAPEPDSPHWWLRLPDPLGRAPGEPIEPERFRVPAIQVKHKLAGTYLTASMYQQRPSPEEGGEIKRAWWADAAVDTLPPSYDDEISSWDMKLKDKESGDYVAGGWFGRTGKDMWLGEVLRGQWNQATTENAIALMQVRHPTIRRHYLENTGNGPEVRTALTTARKDYVLSDDIAGHLGMTETEREKVQALRRRGMNGILMFTPKGEKMARMRAYSGYVESGDVHLWRKMPGIAVFIDEFAAMPNGSHDDQIDMTSQALKILIGGGVSKISRAEGSLPKPKIDTRADGGTMTVTAPTRQQARARVGRAIIQRGVPGSGR